MLNQYFKQFPLSIEDIHLFLNKFEPDLCNSWSKLSKDEQEKVAINIENNHFDKFFINKKDRSIMEDEYISLLSQPFMDKIEDFLMKQYHSQMSLVRRDYLVFSEKRDLNINVTNTLIESMEYFCKSVIGLKQAYKEMLFKQVSVESFLFSCFDLEINFIRGNVKDYKGGEAFTREDHKDFIEEVKSKNEKVDVFTYLKDFSNNENDGFIYMCAVPKGMPSFIDIYLSMTKHNKNAEADFKIISDSLIMKNDFSKNMVEKFINKDSAIYYNSIFNIYYNLVSNNYFKKERSSVEALLLKEYESLIDFNMDRIKSIFKPVYFYDEKSNVSPLKEVITEEAIVYGLLIKNEAVKSFDLSFIKKVESFLLDENEIILFKSFKDSVSRFDKDDLEEMEKDCLALREDVAYIEKLSSIQDFIEKDDKELIIKVNAEKVNMLLYSVYNDLFHNEFKILENYYNKRDFNIKLQSTDNVKIKKYQDSFNDVLKKIESGFEIEFLNCNERDLYKQISNNKTLWLDIKVLFKKDFKEFEKQQYFNIVAKHIKNSIGILYSTSKINQEFLGEVIGNELQHQNMKNDILVPESKKNRIRKF